MNMKLSTPAPSVVAGISRLTGEVFLTHEQLTKEGITFDMARPLHFDTAIVKEHGGLDPCGFVTVYHASPGPVRMYPVTAGAIEVYDRLKAVDSVLV